MINSVTVSGNLTRDMELRATPSNYPIGNLSVAVNDRRKAQDGSWEDYPSYFDCSLLGERAQKLQPYLTKGTKVTVSGKLRQRRWQDKETGANRSAVEIVIDGLEFMSRNENASERPYAPQTAPQQAYRPAPASAPQSAPQAPQGAYQPAPAQGYAPQGYQPAPQAAPQQAAMPVYDADIPF